jgi:hypothetical protein
MDNRQALIFHGVKAAGVVDSGSSAMNGPEGMGLPFTAGSQITMGSIILFVILRSMPLSLRVSDNLSDPAS